MRPYEYKKVSFFDNCLISKNFKLFFRALMPAAINSQTYDIREHYISHEKVSWKTHKSNLLLHCPHLGRKTKFSLQKGEFTSLQMRYVDDEILRVHLGEKERAWSFHQLGKSLAGGVRPVNLRIDIPPIDLHDEARGVSWSLLPCAWRKYWFRCFLSW